VGQSWISQGRVSFAGFLLGLHGGVFLIAMLWITARHFHFSWRNLWFSSTSPSAEVP
jgi:lipopolysaccharide export system permease protein